MQQQAMIEKTRATSPVRAASPPVTRRPPRRSGRRRRPTKCPSSAGAPAARVGRQSVSTPPGPARLGDRPVPPMSLRTARPRVTPRRPAQVAVAQLANAKATVAQNAANLAPGRDQPGAHRDRARGRCCLPDGRVGRPSPRAPGPTLSPSRRLTQMQVETSVDEADSARSRSTASASP